MRNRKTFRCQSRFCLLIFLLFFTLSRSYNKKLNIKQVNRELIESLFEGDCLNLLIVRQIVFIISKLCDARSFVYLKLHWTRKNRAICWCDRVKVKKSWKFLNKESVNVSFFYLNPPKPFWHHQPSIKS